MHIKNKLFLEPTYEFAHPIIRAVKHLLREGCVIRNLFDVGLLLKNHSNNIDFLFGWLGSFPLTSLTVLIAPKIRYVKDDLEEVIHCALDMADFGVILPHP